MLGKEAAMAEGVVWIRKLKVARGEAERATEIRALRSVARKLSIDCNSKDLETARAIAVQRIDELIATQEAQLQKLRSPSPASSSSRGSLASRRSSVSSAARATPAPPSAAAAQAAQPHGTPSSGPLLLRSSGPLVVCPAPTSSDTQTDEEVPAGPLTQLLLESRLLTAEKEIAHFYEELQQTRMGLKEEVMQALAGLKAEPAEEENARLKEELAQVKESNRKLLEQSRTTQAAQLRMQHEMEAMQRQLEEVLAAQSSFMHTRDAVSLLHTEQQQLQAQQRLDECKQCIVFKDSEPLPAKGAAAHLQSKLSSSVSSSSWSWSSSSNSSSSSGRNSSSLNAPSMAPLAPTNLPVILIASAAICPSPCLPPTCLKFQTANTEQPSPASAPVAMTFALNANATFPRPSRPHATSAPA